MNERIKDLIQKATPIHPVHGYAMPLDPEKFAELIVEECIDIVAAGGEFASRPKLVEKLKEHFGVDH
jgi:2,4-dienoyl-CoA reductase-like NADH-dependent reductase (Old Yellow Enzyme family)